MGRTAIDEMLRVPPKIWGRHLMFRFQTDVKGLNRQLTQRPDPHRPLEFGVWPRPLPLNIAPAVFERALELGKDPNNEQFNEPDHEGRFNLFDRVAEHAPRSEDWLFLTLRPYFSPTLPGVDYAERLALKCLKRFGLRRMSSETSSFAIETCCDRVQSLESDTLEAIATHPDPIHITFLLALLHIRQWHEPNGAQVKELFAACDFAASNFAARDEFTWSKHAQGLSQDVQKFFYRAARSIQREGHRSSRPQRGQWEDLRSLRSVFCDSVDLFEDADLCASMAHSIPIWFLFSRPTTNRYCGKDPPNKRQCADAVSDLLDAAVTSPQRWHEYERRSANDRVPVAVPGLPPLTASEALDSVLFPPARN